MNSLIDMNGNPTLKGTAIWEVIKDDPFRDEKENYIKNTTLLFEGTEEECMAFENGIYKQKGYYLNARPFYKETNATKSKLA